MKYAAIGNLVDQKASYNHFLPTIGNESQSAKNYQRVTKPSPAQSSGHNRLKFQHQLMQVGASTIKCLNFKQ